MKKSNKIILLISRSSTALSKAARHTVRAIGVTCLLTRALRTKKWPRF